MELFISVKMILRHTELKSSGANRRLTKLRKLYNIPSYEKITVLLYCKHYRMDVNEFLTFLEEIERREKQKLAKNRLS